MIDILLVLWAFGLLPVVIGWQARNIGKLRRALRKSEEVNRTVWTADLHHFEYYTGPLNDDIILVPVFGDPDVSPMTPEADWDHAVVIDAEDGPNIVACLRETLNIARAARREASERRHTGTDETLEGVPPLALPTQSEDRYEGHS